MLEEEILRKGEDDRFKKQGEEWNEEDGVGEAKSMKTRYFPSLFSTHTHSCTQLDSHKPL